MSTAIGSPKSQQVSIVYEEKQKKTSQTANSRITGMINRLPQAVSALPQEEQATEVARILNDLLPQLPGADKNSSIMTLASFLLAKLPSAPEKEQLAIRSLFFNPEIAPQLSQKKVIEPRIKAPFNESNFSKLSADIESLFAAGKELEEDTSRQIKGISGTTAILQPTASDYNAKKADATRYLNRYELLYNKAIDSLTNMQKTEKEIEQLKSDVNQCISKFTETNTMRIEFFRKLFQDLAQEHQYVSELVSYGKESMKSRWLAAPSAVKTPLVESAKPEFFEEYSKDNFSQLFSKINLFYGETEAFAFDTRKHFNKVAGTRKAWIPEDFDFENQKNAAAKLPIAYESLHTKCLDVFKELQKFNTELVMIKQVLEKNLNEKAVSIRDRKHHLVVLFKKLAAESQTLDQAIHSNSITLTKNIRRLNIDSSDKYPASDINPNSHIGLEASIM